MGDSEIRDLERRVDIGDEAAVEQLITTLERRGVLEDILARVRALLNAAQNQGRGVHVRGDLSVFHVVDALRHLTRPERAAAEPLGQLVFRRDQVTQSRSPHWPFELPYAALAIEGSCVRIATGRCEPDALAAFDGEFGEARPGIGSVFAVSERASSSIPPAEHVVLSRAAARAWVRWCESDPRTQPRDERLDHVRLRPAMWIGTTAAGGLYQLANECLLDVIAEFHEGTVTEAALTLGDDGSLEVSDNGAGLVVFARDRQDGPPPLIACYTNLESRGRSRAARSHAFYPGLMGVGPACVNFLSAWFEVETARDGELWRQRFEQGQPSSRLVSLGKSNLRGTRVRFLPDPTIFPDPRFDFVALSSRLEELSYLCAGLELQLIEEGRGRSVRHRAERGLPDLVSKITNGERPIVDPMFTAADTVESTYSGGSVHVDIALTWTHGEAERVQSFVNGEPTINGGTHVEGLRDSLTAMLEDPATQALMPDGARAPTANEIRLGLNAAIALRVPEPQFEGSTRSRLGSPDVRGVVSQVVGPALARYVRSHPRLVKALALRAGRARLSGG